MGGAASGLGQHQGWLEQHQGWLKQRQGWLGQRQGWLGQPQGWGPHLAAPQSLTPFHEEMFFRSKLKLSWHTWEHFPVELSLSCFAP